MKTFAILAISSVLLLSAGTEGRTRVFRQTEWENFQPWMPFPGPGPMNPGIPFPGPGPMNPGIPFPGPGPMNPGIPFPGPDSMNPGIPFPGPDTMNPEPIPGSSGNLVQTTTQSPGNPPVVDGNGSLLGCNCPAPPQFNPVCGTDGVTYGNLQKLYCAQSCGRSVRVAFMGNCANG